MMLTPFLTFALLEPPQSAQFASLRLILPRALLDGPTNQVVREKVLWFLKGIVPCLQVRARQCTGDEPASRCVIYKVIYKVHVCVDTDIIYFVFVRCCLVLRESVSVVRI